MTDSDPPRLATVASVVIPAHNEELVIGSCLQTLLAGACEGELDVVVVANGCSDRTAEIARSIDPAVRVIETEIGSKPLALDLGDEAALGFPRLYVDADVELTVDSVRKVAAVLRSGSAMVAAPRLRVDVAGRPWRVRAYYDIWTRRPYVRNSHIGSGVYALSEAGRARFGNFPNLLNEDVFVRDIFTPSERASVDNCEFVDRAPATLSAIMRIKGRTAAGMRQYRAEFPDIAATATLREGAPGSGAQELLREPRLWPALAVYASVYAATRIRGWWKFHFGNLAHWEQDQTARRIPVSD